jgi:hypothetical protein
MGTTAWADICSCNICISHIPVGHAGGRAPTVGALGDAGAIAESGSETHHTRVIIAMGFTSCSNESLRSTHPTQAIRKAIKHRLKLIDNK